MEIGILFWWVGIRVSGVNCSNLVVFFLFELIVCGVFGDGEDGFGVQPCLKPLVGSEFGLFGDFNGILRLQEGLGDSCCVEVEVLEVK